MNGRRPDDCFALPPGTDWTPVDVALDRLREALSPITAYEELPIQAAAGRILALPAAAMRDSPPAANSAIDGYAFAAGTLPAPDADGLVTLTLAEGRAAAGHPAPAPVPPGAAVRILTGAEVPEGADTVVLQEDCAVAGATVRFPPPRKAGANVRRAGEDARLGDVLLEPGRKLAPQDLARLAVAGVGNVAVRLPLRVAVLSTGDELIQPGSDPTAAGIFDANRPMLLALAEALGHVPVDLGAVRDDEAALRAALDRGAWEADAILTTGGASAGDEDHVSRLLGSEGRVSTWRIAVKPGRPLAIGTWREKPIFGLPGNPVAAWVCALIFARPALAVMAGQGWPVPRGYAVPAAFEKRKKAGRREYLRARLDTDGRAEAFRSEGSGLVGGLSWAEGLVELPDEAMEIAPGDPVRFLPWSSFGLGRA
ncbi:MAG: gephyrin-like molybdotransferase Glp [Pseudomonadota bacterium]